jgi:Pentapeptide repeats (8 copies)
MITQDNIQSSTNRTESKHESLSKSDDSIKFNEKPWVVLMQAILVPVILALFGIGFSWVQFRITNDRQDADSADKSRETKEQVLTDYGKTIQDLLVTKNTPVLAVRDGYKVNDDQKNIARGHTLIALRRLNIAEKDDDKSKVDAGKLKGLLIRYLYDAQLIGYGYSSSNKLAIMNLSGADINNVVLEDAWLPKIDLHNAWLEKSIFKNASLWSANLKDVRLAGANFMGADLRFAKLNSATLIDAKLTGACYVEGSEDKYFPIGFKPETFHMIAIPEDKSDPSKTNFEPCPAVP